VPAQLLVAVIGILLAAFTGLRAAGVDVIGRVPTGLPLPGLPSLDRIPELIPGALAIAVMAFLETASVARGIRRAGEPQVDSNRELLAAGAASLLGAFLHALPAAGGFSQSAVNQRAGARSQLSSIVTVALAVLVALFLAPVLANLPQATLASMVFVAVIGLIDVKAVVRLARINRIEFWIAAVTAAIGLSAGLLAAVAAGVVFTLGVVLHELGRVRIASRREGSTLLITLQSPLYTASVLATQRAITAELERQTDVTKLVLETSVQRITSLTVLDALSDFDRELIERHITLYVVGLTGDALALAERTGWWSGLEKAGRTVTPFR
jgi:MFS superfamily sulfate permease-like transporter